MSAAPLEAQVFIPGRLLNRRFFVEVLRPLLAEEFPDLVYSAGLLGEGSDVPGYDSPRSMDHNWGPRGLLFVSERDFEARAEAIVGRLSERLPPRFFGYSTNFTAPSDGYLVQRPAPVERGPVNHLVKVFSVRGFVRHYLGVDLGAGLDAPLTTADWLTFPQQALLELVGGEVYQDRLGTLAPTRARFSHYPDDVWLYCMSCQWGRIANELSYPARTGELGDELGSRILAARMVEEIVRLCFLQERTYAPYSKWLGTAFERLESAAVLLPILRRILAGGDWRERQRLFAAAYVALGERHNALGLTAPISTAVASFPGRGYPVVDVSPFIAALREQIRDPALREPTYRIGAIDQFIGHARIHHENHVHREMRCLIR